MSRFRFIQTVMGAVAVALVLAPAAARADSTTSTNWAGWAAHKRGLSFRSVIATWTQPAANCDTPYPTYQATWVGIGGYKVTSNALEQVGTELDCTASGAARSAAWYELVPAPSTRISMTVNPGDVINAAVTVIDHHVTLRLTDRTRHKTFRKSAEDSTVDVSSAEWIVEAPSECFNNNYCRTLPLTNFGTVSFGGARATTAKRHSGSISSGLWARTKITLAPGGHAHVANRPSGRATPTALVAGGSAFSVSYAQPSGSPPVVEDLIREQARAAPAPSPAVNPGGERH